MGVGSFLLGLAGNAAYDSLKVGLAEVFRDDPADLGDRLFAAVDRASARFYAERGERFGRPADSFIARMDNMRVIGRSLHFSEDPLTPDDLDPRGFGEAPDATAGDLERFLELLREEAKGDLFLDKHFSEKRHMRQAAEDSDTIGALADNLKQILQSQASSSDPKTETPFTVVTGGDDDGWVPEQGQIYEHRFDTGMVVRFMLHGDLMGVDTTFADGASWYTDIDAQGNAQNTTLPYPIEEYRLVVDEALVVSRKSTTVGPGLTQEKLGLKWGKSLTAVFDDEGHLKSFYVEGGASMKHKERMIVIGPPASDVS